METTSTLGGDGPDVTVARGRTHVPQLVDLYLEGKLDLDGFISHRLALDQVNHGFELMEEQDGIRSVIVF